MKNIYFDAIIDKKDERKCCAMNRSNSFEAMKREPDPRQTGVLFKDSHTPAMSEAELLAQLKQNKIKSEEIEAIIEVLKIYLSIPEKIKSTDDLMELLQTKNSFLDRVKFPKDREVFRVSLTSRPDGKKLLEDLDPEYVKRLSAINNAEEAAQFLKEKLENTGFEIVTEVQKKELSEESRRILRIDFNGYIEYPDNDKLSDSYRAFNLEKLKRDDEEIEPIEVQYDFKGTFWEKMRESLRMRNYEGAVINALQYNGIGQETLEQMSVYDFEHVFYKYAQGVGQAGMETADFGEGAKKLTVKGFIANHEEEFRQNLKSIGCPDEEADRAVRIMKRNGRVPVIKINENWIMIAEVHHDIAIKDAGQLKNIFEVNNPDKHVLMFEIKEAKRTNLNNKALAAEYKKIKESTAIHLGRDYADLEKLTEDPKAKKEFIKRLAEDKMKELYLGLKSFGVGVEDAQNAVVEMYKKGGLKSPIPAGDLEIGISLKKSKGSLVLEFGVYAPESSQANIHRNIAHGLDAHPQAMVYNPENLPTSLMPKISEKSTFLHKDEKDAFSVEIEGDSPKDIEQRKHFITRLRLKAQDGTENNEEKGQKPIAYFGSLENVIYRNDKDGEWAKEASAFKARSTEYDYIGFGAYGKAHRSY